MYMHNFNKHRLYIVGAEQYYLQSHVAGELFGWIMYTAMEMKPACSTAP